MIRSHLRHTHRQISEINITPFTDVCLVLLIIFLVTANTLTRESSVRLNLPKAVTNTTPLPVSVTVRITSDRQFFVNNVPVTALALMPTLKQRHQQDNSRLLVVKADEKVPYQLVIYTIDTARKVGLDQIALATRQPEPEKPTHVL